MNGYQAFKYYLPCKLHFSQKKFDVFEQSGIIRYPLDKFLARNDKNLFEKFGKRFNTTRELIDFYVSNLSVGLFDFVYLSDEAEDNYKSWKKYKQNFTYEFKKDLSIIESYIEDTKEEYKLAIWNCHINYKIALQSFFVLNEKLNIINEIDAAHSLLFEEENLRIVKLKGFLKIPDSVVEESEIFLRNYDQR